MMKELKKKSIVVMAAVSLFGAAAASMEHEEGGESKTVTVEATEFAFSPATVTAEAGEPLTLRLKNEGSVSHNLTIKKLDAGTGTIPSGETDQLTLEPGQPGTYQYICTVPGHAEAGMKGELIVK